MEKITRKPMCIIRAPVATRSGYGDMSRDIVRHFIESDKFDVKVHSVPWGDTPMNALDPTNPMDKMILDRFLTGNVNQPEVFVSVTIPEEFQPLGKYNIGITAGIETTVASVQWVEGCNKMDTIWLISEHSKNVFQFSKYTQRDQAGNSIKEIQVTKPMEVLHNCINPDIIKKLEYEFQLEPVIREEMAAVEEDFNFLFVGHWLQGEFSEDRKNVGFLVKIFLETFRQVGDKKKPGLILKTSGAGFSILDREELIKKINRIRDTVVLADGQTLPNIYLLHGELTDKEMNSLYNHPKVKAHVSFTKGEGFGRPLLEASISGKPIIASGWSGHVDFLDNENAVLVGGELKEVHPSAQMGNMIIKEATWFQADPAQSMNAMAAVFLDYSPFKKRASALGKKNGKNFSYEAIRNRTIELIEKYVPKIATEVELKLPPLQKKTITENV
jgi:glycosyltransferase involved in cell wall biosynthesis